MRIVKLNRKVFTLLLCALAAAVLLAAACFGYYRLTKHLIREDTSVLLQEINRQSSSTVAERNQLNFDHLHTVSKAVSSLNTPLFDSAVLEYLQREINLSGGVLRYIIADEFGNVRTTDGYTAYHDLPESYQTAMRGMDYLSNPVKSRFDNENTVIHLAVPVERNGKIVGALTCVYTTQSYESLLPESIFEGMGSACVVRATGESVIFPEDTNNLLPLFSLQQSFTDNPSTVQGNGLESLPAALASGAHGTLYYHAESGPAYLSYTPMELKDWYLISAVPANIVAQKMAAVGLLSGLFLVISLVLCVLVAIVVYFARHKRQQALKQLAYYDALTGLPRMDKLEEFFSTLSNKHGWVCVLVTLHRRHLLRQIFSQSSANELIRRVAARLQTFVGASGCACALDEEQFCLLTPAHGAPSNLLSDLRVLTSHLELLKVNESGTEYNFHCTFVCSAWPLTDSDTSIRDLLQTLTLSFPPDDTNLDASVCTLVSEKDRSRLMLHAQLATQAEAAFQHRQFNAYFQPQYALGSKRIVGAEVLARWDHPDRGLLFPGEFMPILDAEGFSLRLDLYMLEEACKEVRQWTEAELLPVPVTINISPLNIYKPDFIDLVISTVQSYQIPPVLIVLEMSETSAVANNSVQLREATQRLHDFGMLLSLDDFGSGSSSLTLLPELPIDILKLGRFFFRDGNITQRERSVLDSVVAMARRLKIQVVAQNVELQPQADLLKAIGCNAAQGYLYSKPLSSLDFAKLIF